MTFDEAIAELRRLVAVEVHRAVLQFAAEVNVTPDKWLEKCTIDVSYKFAKGLTGEEIEYVVTARKRTPEDGPPRSLRFAWAQAELPLTTSPHKNTG
jgi:hypothetical protein